MKKTLEKYGEIIIFCIILIILAIIFFRSTIVLTWDSSEYIGLSKIIGTEEMKMEWIGHRGIGFPLLIKLAQIIGGENKYSLLGLMFIFYISMLGTLYLVYRKLKQFGILKNIILILIYIWYTIYFIALNPMIFGYYHTTLTEFVAFTILAITVYTTWIWMDCYWEENKRKTIIISIIFAINAIIIYHVKQSLITLVLIPICGGAVLSVINKFNLSNIISKILTLLFVGITLIISIKLWGIFMQDYQDVLKNTNDARINNRILAGAFGEQIADKTNFNKLNIDTNKIDSEDYKKITEIIDGQSNYKNFKLYLSYDKERYITYFVEEDDGLGNQIKCYLKEFCSDPLDIIGRYKSNYWKIIFKGENVDLKARENFNIPSRIYFIGVENVVDVNKDYEHYIENYREMIEYDKTLAKLQRYIISGMGLIINYMQISLWYAPIMLLVWGIIYLIIRIFFYQSINKNIFSTIQFIIVLYATTFGAIMSYVVLGACIDRYAVPMTLTAFLANFLTILIITEAISSIIKKKMNNTRFIDVLKKKYNIDFSMKIL